MTHAFHPLFGQQFDLTSYKHCWGEDRVFYLDESEQVRSLPACWTSAVADVPFLVVSGGRSHFRLTDLLELGAFVRGAMR